MKCPECHSWLKVEFPPSFYFAIALVKCKCGYKGQGSGDCASEAKKALKEIINKLAKRQKNGIRKVALGSNV